MATLETFKWRTQGTPEGQITASVDSVQFGDGYEQVVSVGLNSIKEEWPVSYVAREQEVKEIIKFMKRHFVRAFIWTPPLGEKGLYRVVSDSLTIGVVGGKVASVSATFKQAFSAEGI
ncbi:tail protein [Serratia phage vB_SlqS_ZDD2]|nr:tail protein [Serratia phage vB_SlqS_ZDD2]